MKTTCPHCKQEYPETPDEYLGMTLQCSVCQKEFVCEKPKFCSECGTANPSKAIKCSFCGKNFPTMQIQPPRPPVHYYPQNNCSGDDEIEVPWYKRLIFMKREKVEYGANGWGLLAILLSLGACFVPILTLPAIIYALFVHASKGQRYTAIAIVVLRMIVTVAIERSKLG